MDVPPPGAELKTVMVRCPRLKISLFAICALSCVGLTNVVGLGEPLTCTTDPLINPVPFTVSVKLGPNATAVAGEILEMVGVGFSTANVKAVEAPPPGEGLTTVIERLAAVATSDAGICAVN